MGAAAGLLVLVQAGGCKSPEDIGFDAAAQFTAPMSAIGADTMTTPCEERIQIFEDLVTDPEFAKKRSEVAEKVEGAVEKDGFDQGFDRLADIPQKVFTAFERDCPEQTPKAKELAMQMAKQLHIESKVAWLPKV